MLNQHESSRLAALHWILILHKKLKLLMDAHFDKLFSPLLKTLSDSSENVARMALQVLARLSNEETNEKENEEESKGTKWNKLVTNLILLFATDRNLLLARGSLIIRQICDFVNPTKIYTTMSKILVKAEVGPSPSFQTLCYHSQTKKGYFFQIFDDKNDEYDPFDCSRIVQPKRTVKESEAKARS